jgi:hypothetical protein
MLIIQVYFTVLRNSSYIYKKVIEKYNMINSKTLGKLKNNIIILSGGAGTFISFFLLLLLFTISNGGNNNISSAEPTDLKIIVFVDSLANDKGKVTVRDHGDDFLGIKPYTTDSKGSTTVEFTVPHGKIGANEEFTVTAKSSIHDVIDSDKGINRPLNAPEHVVVNTFLDR